MQESGAAAGVADDEYWLAYIHLAITRKQDFIQKEKKMVNSLIRDKNEQPEKKDEESLWSKTIMLTAGHKKGFEVIA
jgi:hypothetical protein